jgi:hypothetical protein
MMRIILISCVVLLASCASLKEAGKTIGGATKEVTTTIGHASRDAVKTVGKGAKEVVEDIKDDGGND